ncbi:MAG: restriction endonuclease [Candidatus Bathyarchaeia archaeon]|jgi:hypothetical protein
MSYNPQSGRTFEDIVEGMLNFMGYNTKAHHTLQTRQPPIRAEIQHAKGKKKLYIECKCHEPVGIHDVECFCAKVAHAREKLEVDGGLLISNTGFSPEAISWCERNCSFVQLKTYRQLISFSARYKKLLSKFCNN